MGMEKIKKEDLPKMLFENAEFLSNNTWLSREQKLVKFKDYIDLLEIDIVFINK